MPEQPETSYYNVSGQPRSEPSPLDEPGYVPGERSRRERSAGERSAGERNPGDRNSNERGLPSWMAVLLLIAVSGVGGIIDSASGSAIRGAFNYSLVIASLLAILLVKRSQMFSVVISPPLVYFVASASLLYVRTGGLHNRGKLYDAATNWVVYGFPAIAGATAIVLVIAGIRMVIHR